MNDHKREYLGQYIGISVSSFFISLKTFPINNCEVSEIYIFYINSDQKKKPDEK